jgi:hypothetical protein
MTIKLTREGYLEQRLTKGRAQIANELKMSYGELSKMIKNWGYQNLDEEQAILERMRVARGLPSRPTRGPQPTGAASRPASPSNAVATATANTAAATQMEVNEPSNIRKAPAANQENISAERAEDEKPTLDFSQIEWIPPVTRKTVSLRFTRAGIRISGPLSKKLVGVSFVAIGFIKQACVIRPDSHGWKVKQDKKCDGCIVGSARIVQAAKKFGFDVNGSMVGEWVNGALVLQPSRSSDGGDDQ